MPLDPQARQFLDTLSRENAPDWHELTPDEGRKIFAGLTELFGVGPELPQVEDRTMAACVPVRIYRPDATPGQAALVYFHGGGWVLGDLNTHDALCRRLAAESSSVVVAVDYRRAPEHRFPAALDDCLAVTKYVAEHAEELGVDAARLGVIGDSAGGALAAGVALLARDQGGPSLRAQILIVPVISPDCDTPSYAEFADGYGLTNASMKWFWEQYTGDGKPVCDPYAALLRADDLRGLPPAHVVTAEYDVLRDEGEAFALRLRETGVLMTSRRYDGMIHGFVHLSAVFDAGSRAVSDLAAVASSMLAK